MCTCVLMHACELFLKIILFYFVFKETKYIDDGRCICMSVCMYVELNWFPGKEK